MADSARRYAMVAHGEQRYGDKPYVSHLDAVVDVLREFGYFQTTLIAAAYLHDTIEDTLETHDSLVVEFGPLIADLVWLVTDQPGKNRAERHQRTYPLLAMEPMAVTLKLADRIANVRASAISDPSLLSMYRREYGEFQKHLRSNRDGRHAPMWDELDRLLTGGPA